MKRRVHDRRRRSVSLRGKLLLAFMTVVATTVAASAVGLSSLSTVADGIDQVVVVGGTLDEAAMTAGIAGGRAVEAAQAYLLEYETLGLEEADRLYAATVHESLGSIHDEMATIREVANEEVTADTHQVDAIVDDYEAAFDALEAAVVDLGHGGSGIEGELAAASRTIDEFVEPMGLAEIEAKLHELMVGQLEFASEGGEPAVVLAHLEELATLVASSDMDAADRRALNGALDSYGAAFSQYQVAFDQVDTAQAAFSEAGARMHTLLEEIEADGGVIAGEAETALTDVMATSRTLVLVIAAAAVLLGVTIGLLVARSIARRVAKVSAAADLLSVGATEVELDIRDGGDEIDAMVRSVASTVEYLRGVSAVAEEIADGNLTVEPVPRSESDTLGHAVVAMVQGLRDVVGSAVEVAFQLKEGSTALATASEESAQAAGEVAVSIGTVADGATTQAAITEEFSGAVQRIAADVDLTMHAVSEVMEASNIATVTASEGQSQIELAEQAIGRIKDAFHQVATAAEGLDLHSAKVEEIVGLIRAIAEQTNLLALNAAIEAARAGEAGRGFAVVASEVKTLAEESAKSSDEITTIVSQMRGSVTETVEVTRGVSSEVDTGTDVVGKASDAFGAIVEAINEIRGKADGVAEAGSRIQKATISIEDGASRLVQVTESNSAASEEVAASSEQTAASSEELGATAQELSATSESLNTTMSRFRVR